MSNNPTEHVSPIEKIAAKRAKRIETAPESFRRLLTLALSGKCSPRMAEYVRQRYGHEPDMSGSDVSRASFVSFDNGLWFFGSAEILPIRLSRMLHSGSESDTAVYHSAVYGGRLALTCWTWYGRHLANTSPQMEGTAKTHRSLLDLGKGLALHAERIGERLTERQIDEALSGWLAEYRRQGIQLRCSSDEYRAELIDSVRGAQRKPWFCAAAVKWLRWTRHQDFPKRGTPDEKLLFAIRRHCEDAGSKNFYLGARDAALIVGGHFTTGARLLRQLVMDGHLEKTADRRKLREAQTYRLFG